jgi:hypothetical protein
MLVIQTLWPQFLKEQISSKWGKDVRVYFATLYDALPDSQNPDVKFLDRIPLAGLLLKHAACCGITKTLKVAPNRSEALRIRHTLTVCGRSPRWSNGTRRAIANPSAVEGSRLAPVLCDPQEMFRKQFEPLPVHLCILSANSTSGFNTFCMTIVVATAESQRICSRFR